MSSLSGPAHTDWHHVDLVPDITGLELRPSDSIPSFVTDGWRQHTPLKSSNTIANSLLGHPKLNVHLDWHQLLYNSQYLAYGPLVEEYSNPYFHN